MSAIGAAQPCRRFLGASDQGGGRGKRVGEEHLGPGPGVARFSSVAQQNGPQAPAISEQPVSSPRGNAI